VQHSDDAPLCPSEALVMPGRFSTGLPSWCPLAIVRLPREKKCPSLNLFTPPGYALAQAVPSARAAWPFPLLRQHWEQPPPAVQAYLRTGQLDLAPLHDLPARVGTLEARLHQDSPALDGCPTPHSGGQPWAALHFSCGQPTPLSGGLPFCWHTLNADTLAPAIARP